MSAKSQGKELLENIFYIDSTSPCYEIVLSVRKIAPQIISRSTHIVLGISVFDLINRFWHLPIKQNDMFIFSSTKISVYFSLSFIISYLCSNLQLLL